MKSLWAFISSFPKLVDQLLAWVKAIELYIRTKNASKNQKSKADAIEEALNAPRMPTPSADIGVPNDKSIS